MSKYFIDEKEIQLSTYLERELSDKMKKTVEYLIHCLGDVSLPVYIIDAYRTYFYSSEGRYDVRTEEETIKGLYEFYKKFPSISGKAFYEISVRYIKDLFEDYSLVSVFEKLIKEHGESDETLETFITSVEKKADELQKKYFKQAILLRGCGKFYHVDGLADDYIPFLKSLVIKKHIPIEKIIESMPSPELVKEDRMYLHRLAVKYCCYFGCGYPASYLLTEAMAKGEDLSKYGERPLYSISLTDKPIKATFTIQEFIESTKQDNVKKLIRNKQ